ncbi:hypothetical protein B6N60_04477 [Richelia sinica FACHB-800]|uniref:DUF4276 family protein n=1 Tax=Richelia sinica FACHB-800 TaxID=1357546 RepID=A0A975TCX9_9NOST|nr:hypothetical protein [Richelia sinica]MBD2665719.1 hypothetical protein [Richelia sinica FACHB-800]QXE25757.1 hypothetical protein B6N60_04477 [Richelia sinica FACHB-800]
MVEFIVIVESGADARTATKLAERVLKEKLDWLDDDSLKYYFRWTGLESGAEYSCWRDIKKIVDDAKKQLKYHEHRYLGHHSTGIPLKADGAASLKVLKLVRFLQKTRNIKSVLFIRDLDNQLERREGLEQARLQHINLTPKLEIVIGAADPKREAWVLNGFIASNNEQAILENIKNQLNFDPCIESHRLRSTSEKEPERIRNVKVVVEQLTGKDMEREKKCWEETSLEVLRARGIHTGLTAFLQEVEERLVAMIVSG